MENEPQVIDTRNGLIFLYYNNEIPVKPSERTLPAYGYPINRGDVDAKITVLTVGGQTVTFTLRMNEWSPCRVKKIFSIDNPEVDIHLLV